MPDHPKPQKKSPRSSKDFQIPPIPKQTAGAVTGAAIGSIAGPTGAVVGGVVGALVGRATSDGRPVRKAVRRATGVSKAVLKRQPLKRSLTKSRRGGGRSLRAKGAKRTRSQKSSAAKSQKRTVRAPRRINKVSAKIDIVACAAETPRRWVEKALKRLSCLLAKTFAFPAGTLGKATPIFLVSWNFVGV